MLAYPNLILKDINFSVSRGSFVIIVGEVGSGKSSVLSAVLSEMIHMPGTQITLNGSVSYVGQKSFIMNGSIRDNVLFGSEYEEVRYQNALRYSCFLEDLKIF